MDHWRTYYAMKSRLGGEKFTARDKLVHHWNPTPGCNMHKSIVGNRRGGILFEKYCGLVTRGNPNLMYWRSHPKEWSEIQRRVKM